MKSEETSTTCTAIVLQPQGSYRKIAQKHWGLTNHQMIGMHVHHRIARSQGGTNDPSNLYVCSPWFHANVWHGVPSLLKLIKNSHENAVKGGQAHKGRTLSLQHREKIASTLIGRKDSQETKERKRKAKEGITLSQAHSSAISEGRKKTKKVSCPHCSVQGQPHTMARWHFDNCKQK